MSSLARRSTPLLTASVLASMLLAVSAPAASRHHHRHRHAHTAIVGGAPIPISQVPWQASVQASIPEGTVRLRLRCGGAILDDFHILTAAHCTFDPKTNQRIPPEDFLVRAGTADLTSPEPGEQTREVTSVRAHPYYVYAPTAVNLSSDDVAVLTLAEPLTFSGLIGPIELAAIGSIPPEGATTALAGFGEQTPGTESNGHLYGLQMSLAAPRECGGESSALVVCASSPSGSPCSGDSGSGLILPGSPLTLVGVMDSGQVIAGKKCAAGELATFANVAAGEIQDFIDGSETPPRAPRGEGVSCTVNGNEVGDTMICQPGTWSEAPTFTYTFTSEDGKVLQSGAADTYRFTEADVGSTVVAQLQATTAGGTAVDRAQPTQPVSAAQRQPARGVSLSGGRVEVRAGRIRLRLSCPSSSRCRGRVTLTGWRRPRRAHPVAFAAGAFSLAPGSTRTLDLKLTGAARKLLRAGARRIGVRVLLRQLAPAYTRQQSAHLILRG